ncbi:MAG: hypothetical protein ACI9MC_000518, partial [Kiritimatiellia bacterium]
MNRIFYAMVFIAFTVAAALHLTWQPAETQPGRAVTQLTDGRAMVVARDRVTIFDGAAWSSVPPSSVSRVQAMLMPVEGGAISVGGLATEPGLLTPVYLTLGIEQRALTQTAERWDADTLRWGAIDPAPVKVHSAQVVVLDDGVPLFVGGETESGASAAVIAWRDDVGLWQRLSDMPEPRAGHRVVRLSDGNLLVVGGVSGSDRPVSDALLYDPKLDTWARVAGPQRPRVRHELLALPDGGALLVGGEIPAMGLPATAERFDPLTRTWRPSGQTERGRTDGGVLLLSDGRVVVAGGMSADGEPVLSAEVRDNESWTATAPLRYARSGAVGMTIAGSSVLLGGDHKGAVVYDLKKDTWKPLNPSSPMENMGMGMIDTAG